MKLRWGIIGAGHIARELANGINGSETGQMLAIASCDAAKATAFGEQYAIPRRYGTFPTFPLIGPKQITETASCMKVLDIELTAEDLRWLDLGAG